MVRIVKLSEQYYSKRMMGLRFDEDIDDIQEFISSCDPVLLANDVDEAAYFLGINVDCIEVVEPDDED